MEDAHVESVEGLDHSRDENDEHADDDPVVYLEQQREPFCPAQVGMRSADQALAEQDIEDEEDDDARSDEYLNEGLTT